MPGYKHSLVIFLQIVGVLAALTIPVTAADDHRRTAGEQKDMNNEIHRQANHLIGEKSPYLLQHAYNPVEWYPWGEEALARAKRENKLIFLSIGYSTCHWCHVMEEESFEDEEIADLLNRYFICIKVDREERPDLDAIYMTAVQALTGRGGWPLNLFLTPELQPFYGGTYFPPEDQLGRPGIKTIVHLVAARWKETPADIRRNGERLTEVIRKASPVLKDESGQELPPDFPDRAVAAFSESYDSVYGGFGRPPKFPQATVLGFLLRAYHRTGKADTLTMVENTLRHMARGGIYDQLGGGFHRYSTDNKWLIPHFEKMLYDNALLSRVYLEAFQITGKSEYRTIARQTLDYVLREMTDPGGGFYSAQDADSDGEEGAFYVWTPDEVESLLDRKRAKIFNQLYGVTPKGNFDDDTSILHLATKSELPDEKQGLLAEAREILLQARSKRIPPHRDDKILTAWNGLMIGSLAYAGQVLNAPAYTAAAVKAAYFIMDNLATNHGLLRRYRDGVAGIPAYLTDYAFLVQGLIELYQATFEPQWLTMALKLNRAMLERFTDAKGGGFFFSRQGDPTLIVRSKKIHDGALPSGNAAALLNMLRLSEFTEDAALRDKAAKILIRLAEPALSSPGAYAQTLTALNFLRGPHMEIAVAGFPGHTTTRALLHAVRRPFLPNKVLAFTIDGEPGRRNPVAFLAGKVPIAGKPTVYICRDSTCKRPLTDPREVRQALQRK